MSAEQDLPEAQDKNLPLIAVVDDDPLVRKTMASFLSGIARVVTGQNAHDALRLLREEKLALMTLDDIMPGGMTGLSFLESIKDDPVLSKTPIIMATASNKPEEVLRGLNAGAADYLGKPVQAEALMKAVRAVLDRRPNVITLMLRDAALAAALTERLGELACDVSRTSSVEEGVAQTRTPDLYVLDRTALPFLEGLTQRGASCLCLATADELPQNVRAAGSVTAIGDGEDMATIIRQIGALLTKIKRRKSENA